MATAKNYGKVVCPLATVIAGERQVKLLDEHLLLDATRWLFTAQCAAVGVGLANVFVSLAIVWQLWGNTPQIGNAIADNKAAIIAVVAESAKQLEANSVKLDELLKLLRHEHK